MELAQKTKFLRQCRPFSYMADEDVTLFAQSARLIDCAASTLLYREKDSAKGLIVVISGVIRSFTYEPDGRILEEARAVAGESIGWLSIVDAGVRTAEAVAVGALRYLAIPRLDVDRILCHNPHLWQAVARIMADRLRIAKSSRRGLAVNQLEKRVAGNLRDLVLHADDGASDVVLSITQQEIADLCMASRQRVNKCLKDLERDGVLALGYQKITIIDGNRLRAMANLII